MFWNPNLFFGNILDMTRGIAFLQLSNMSSGGLGGFLFGNIDEEGKLDNEDFDEVTKILKFQSIEYLMMIA